MIKNRASSPCPSARESIWGACYLLFQMLALPSFLYWANGQADISLSDTELNFLFYIINFVAVLLIFHNFLARSLSQLLHHPIDGLQAAILGFVAYYVCFHAMEWIIGLLRPGYTNYNDDSIAALSRGNFFLMAIGTVVLVPITEECLYRGLIFRNLYRSSQVAAYLLSMAAFAALHVLGYIGTDSAMNIFLSFIQYFPVSFALIWAMEFGGSIWASIAESVDLPDAAIIRGDTAAKICWRLKTIFIKALL